MRHLRRGLPCLCFDGASEIHCGLQAGNCSPDLQKALQGAGKAWPSVGDSKELTEMALEELYDAAYSCTGCRRCMVYCPFGIDTQMLMSIAKLLLVAPMRNRKS